MASKGPHIEFPPESRANNHLALHLYKLLTKEGRNVFISPFSLSTILAMLFCGTESGTSKEMRRVLGYDEADISDEEIKHFYAKLLTAVEGNQDSYTITYANSVLCNNDFCIKDEFKTLLEEHFKASFQEVDFRNESSKAVQEVNTWVREKTNGMIPYVLDYLDPNTVMVLLNAVYFKGFWKKQFDKNDTSLRWFYNKGNENEYKQVAMMRLEKTFLFMEKESFKAVQLPYRGDEISMMVLLPKSINGLEELENSLSPTFFQEQFWWPTKVKVSLPKFRLEYSKSMKEQFQSLGLNRIFSPGAQFGGISDSAHISISEIVHKAVIEVNEEGSEAGAIAEMIPIWDLDCEPEFVADHPFMFVIYNQRNSLILFMGRVNEL